MCCCAVPEKFGSELAEGVEESYREIFGYRPKIFEANFSSRR